jgi:hypothetical protein
MEQDNESKESVNQSHGTEIYLKNHQSYSRVNLEHPSVDDRATLTRNDRMKLWKEIKASRRSVNQSLGLAITLKNHRTAQG